MLQPLRSSRLVFGVLVLLCLTGLEIHATQTHAQAAIPLPEPAAAHFTLEYPSDTRPASILRKFVKPAHGKTPHEGVDLAAKNVLAGAGGVVKKVVPAENGRGWGAYVTIATEHDGVRHRVSYGYLTDILVQDGDQVTAGQKLAETTNGIVKVVIQASQAAGGMSGFNVRNVMNPKPILRLNGLVVRPIDNGLRVRSQPDLNAPIIAQISQWDRVHTLEAPYNAMLWAGKAERWLQVQLSDNTVGYASAQYLKVVSLFDPVEGIPGIPMRGMNLDVYSPFGTPPTAALDQLGWVRLNYNLSYNPVNGTYGNTDLWATYNRYYPIIKQYADNGNKVILVLTHQLYGEGQGYVWEQMTHAQWMSLITAYSNLAQQVAAQYTPSVHGKKLVYAYQLWNEQDTLPNTGRAAVPVPSDIYATLFSQTKLAIKLGDPRAKVITGGHITGDVSGVNYANTVMSLLPTESRPDGIAFHPYGQGAVGSPFSQFGSLSEAIKRWSDVLPNKPLWITEWGVLDHTGNEGIVGQVTDYATSFVNILEQEFPGMIASASWFAWSDGMDNGYGMVNSSGQPRQPLYTAYLGVLPVFEAYLNRDFYTNPNPQGLIPLP